MVCSKSYYIGLDHFRYRVIRLWQWDARDWISNKQAIPFYGLLPAMDHLAKEILLQAIDEMVHYYRGNDPLLRDELLCFRVMLKRAKRLPEPNLEEVLRRVSMFDQLLEEDPWVQSLQARSREEGIAEGIKKGIEKGITQGELKAARNLLIDAVRLRFPALTSLAEIRSLQLEKLEPLKLLFEQVVLASDENMARMVLETYPNA